MQRLICITKAEYDLLKDRISFTNVRPLVDDPNSSSNYLSAYMPEEEHQRLLALAKSKPKPKNGNIYTIFDAAIEELET